MHQPSGCSSSGGIQCEPSGQSPSALTSVGSVANAPNGIGCGCGLRACSTATSIGTVPAGTSSSSPPITGSRPLSERISFRVLIPAEASIESMLACTCLSAVTGSS